jgi:hypothetical protein
MAGKVETRSPNSLANDYSNRLIGIVDVDGSDDEQVSRKEALIMKYMLFYTH